MESSRASCSSSCSSFSSVNDAFYTEKFSKETLRPKTAPCYSEFRNIVKDSINREPHEGLTLKTSPKEEMPKKMLKHNDSPRPLLLAKSTDGTYVIGIDRSINYEYELKCNSYYTSRFSCDGRELPSCTHSGPKDFTKASTGLRDLPRLSLDSRKESLKRSNIDFNSCRNYDSPGHRRSNSLIARLMGLDLFPDCNELGNVSTVEAINPVESLRNRRDYCLSNFSKSNVKENDAPNSVKPTLVVKTKTPMRTGTESAPCIQQEKNGSKKMISEIERRLWALDLHAKERIQSKGGAKSPRSFDSPIVIMKPAKYGKRATNTNSCHATPIAGLTSLRKLQQGGSQERRQPFVTDPKAKERDQGSKLKQSSKENSANSPRTSSSSSPRISERDSDWHKKSHPSSPSSSKRNSVSDLGSPRSKFRPNSFPAKKNSGQKSPKVDLADPFIPEPKVGIISQTEIYFTKCSFAYLSL
jgi:hypothetical protein